MAKTDDPLIKMREICLALPDTKETPTWGEPHFRVGDKIFAGYGEKEGRASIGFKLAMLHAEAVVREDPRFSRAPYVGHKGWVSMDVTDLSDWGEVRPLVLESYRLIAPKKTLAKLDGAAASAPASTAPKKTTKTPAAKKPRSPAASKSAPPAAKKTAKPAAKKTPKPAAKKTAKPAAKKPTQPAARKPS
jgi:predicted DNA-binding protein (MmcQ/YjbR family)